MPRKFYAYGFELKKEGFELKKEDNLLYLNRGDIEPSH